MSEPTSRPRVGTGIWIRKEGKVLLGKRKGKRGPDTWCPPGGKLEMFEDPLVCATREAREECGLEVENVRFITITNDVYQEYGEHWITAVFVADWKSGEPEVLEPDKLTEWGWYDWDMLPQPLLRSTSNFLKTGYNPLNF